MEKREQEGWGTKITRRLSEDLGKEFPNMKGFSYTNINYTLKFARAYPDLLIFPQPVGKLQKNRKNIIFQAPICTQAAGKLEENYFVQESLKEIINIPWGHNREILDKIENQEQRLWYAKETIKNGWSRSVLVHQISTNLYKRQALSGAKTHNFNITLPKPHSDLAQEMFKHQYDFGFINANSG